MPPDNFSILAMNSVSLGDIDSALRSNTRESLAQCFILRGDPSGRLLLAAIYIGNGFYSRKANVRQSEAVQMGCALFKSGSGGARECSRFAT